MLGVATSGNRARQRHVSSVTLVLVGKVGCGKSATANNILGRKAFASERSYTSVTKVYQMAQMWSTTLPGGRAEARTINIIDTPGLFNMNTTTEDTHKEIAKCTDMSRDGIHAVLMVFPADSRFSHEDVNTIESIKMFFGHSIVNHMILVFTHGDQVEEVTWQKMLSNKDAKYLQDVVKLCSDRVVLFDNNTRDLQCQQEQLKELLDAVYSVISSNNGIPSTMKPSEESCNMLSINMLMEEEGDDASLFHSRCKVGEKVCAMTINNDSSINAGSIELVEKLGLSSYITTSMPLLGEVEARNAPDFNTGSGAIYFGCVLLQGFV